MSSLDVKNEEITTQALRVGEIDTIDSSLPKTKLLNPFVVSDRPSFDPESEHFSPRQLFESLAEFRRHDPTRYPAKAFGVSYRNLNVHGYKTSTDYQYTFGNYPGRLISRAFGQGKTPVTILNNLDGFIKQGEMLLVLGPR